MADIWYQISQYGKPTITPIEIEKETPEFVVYYGRDWEGKKGYKTTRQAKAGEFFRTFAEAKSALALRYEKALIRALENAQYAKERIEATNKLEEGI